MKRLLNILASMDVGGAETMIMKLYRQIDKNEYQMDFALMSAGKSFYEDEISSLGGKIFHITYKSKNPVKCFREIRSIVKENKYHWVMRSADNAAGAIDLLAAKLGGAKTLVFNSTNSKTYSESKQEKLAHFLFMPLVKTLPTLKIGCSEAANDFLFGKNSVKNHKSFIFHNALEIRDYKYNQKWRNEIRAELGIPNDALVIGNVGRFNRQKNHKFLLAVFSEIFKTHKNAYLALFGTGELKDDILNKAREYGFSKNLIMPGLRSDINKCLSALDVFAFPSLYEGLPNAVVEAEAAGLPCILSDTITREVKLAENVRFLPIDEESTEKWASEIVSNANDRNPNAESDLENAGYSIDETADKLVKLIFGTN